MYAFGVGFFGLNNIVTLAAIAVERYIVITAKPAAAKWRITRRQARKVRQSLNQDQYVHQSVSQSVIC